MKDLRVNGRLSHILLTTALILFCFSSRSFAVSVVGATIESNIYLQYDQGFASSEFTFVTVGQTYGMTVEPAALNAYGAPQATHYFPHQIENLGNGSDRITFAFTYATPETWIFGLKRDLNGDGLFVPADGDGDLSNPLLIAEEALVHFLVAVTIPTNETAGTTGNCVILITGEVNDGGPYMGVNGTIYGGTDSAEVADILTSEATTDLMIHREDSTGRIYLTWNGGNADVYFLNDSFNPSFEGAMIESSGESSPYNCLTLEAKDGKIRYYRIKLGSSPDYVDRTVGKYDINTIPGFMFTSVPFVFTSEASASLDAVIGTQMTAGLVPSTADRFYNFKNSISTASWKQSYLKSGIGWTGTAILFSPDIGAWLRILEGHPSGKLTYVGIVSTAASREIMLYQGYNMVGTAYPVDVSLEATDLDHFLTPGVDPADADRIYTFDGSMWKQSYLGTGGVWHGTVTKLVPGRAYWVKKQGAAVTWYYPRPY